MLSVNVRAGFMLGQLAAREMVKRENRGSILFMSSILDQLPGGSDALEAFQSGGLAQDLKKALALRGVAAKWKRPPQFWSQVRGEFAIRFEERFRMIQE